MSRNDLDSGSENERSTRRRRWQRSRWLLALLPLAFLAAALLWLVPTIVAHSSLMHKIVSAALEDFEGQVTVGSASLGWLSPLTAYDIAAVDIAGQPLGHVKTLHSERTLLGLLSNPGQPGGFRLEQPEVQLLLRHGGSNWEDALAAYLGQSSGESSLDQIQLTIVGGTIEVREGSGTVPWRVQDLDADLQLHGGDEPRLQMRAEAEISAAGAQPGRVSAELGCGLGQGEESIGGGQVDWQLEELPIGPWASLLARAGLDATLQGTLAGRGSCRWEAGLANLQLRVEQLLGREVALRAPAWLGDDCLQTASLNVRGQILQDGDRWRLEDVLIATDFGRLEARGALPPLNAVGTSWAELARQLQQESIEASGNLDLPRLAATLPGTLRIRENTRITSGGASFRLASGIGGEPSFTATMEIAGLAASEGGKTFAWTKPLTATADFHYAAEGPVIDQLVCRADFLDVVANGTLTEGSASVRGQLARLKDEIGHFIDLGTLKLEGQLDGDLRWQQASPGQVEASGRIQLSGFHFDLQDPAAKPWTERQLVIDMAAAAQTAEGRIIRIPSASLRLQSDADQLTVKLRQPVEQPSADAAWPLTAKIAGRLETWLPRLQPVWDAAGWSLSGNIDLDATATVRPDQVAVETLKLQLAQLHAQDAGQRIVIDENAVRLETAGNWERQASRIAATDTVLTSSTVAFRAQQVVLQLPGSADGAPQAASASGQLSYRADLGRLSDCFPPTGAGGSSRVGGSVTGVVRASHQADATSLDWTADIQSLVYSTSGSVANAVVRPVSTAAAWRDVWREPSLRLAGRKRYDGGRDLLQIENLTAATQTLKLAVAGSVAQLSTDAVADVKGTLDYDLADVTRQLQATWGPVKLTGRQQGQFSLNGPLRNPTVAASSAAGGLSGTALAIPQPLVPPQLAATFDCGWQSADAYGMRVGGGELRGVLSDCVLRIDPLDLPVSDGRVKAAPRLDLHAQPVRLILDRGPLIENVLISPEMCQSWLKYVAPLLADATRAEGRFSVTLDGASVPLPDSQRGVLGGEVLIHSARVGPGPLAQQFLGIAQQVKTMIDGRPASLGSQSETWLNVPKQQVKFDVREGRVHHQGLTVTAGDLVIRTTGSVGFDQTLALVAEVPVQDAWVANKRLLESLKGTTLQLPIRGTLSQPQVDSRTLSDLNRQIMQNAAGRVLEDELGRGLQRLFGPQQ